LKQTKPVCAGTLELTKDQKTFSFHAQVQKLLALDKVFQNKEK
jgi:hypothetical protein